MKTSLLAAPARGLGLFMALQLMACSSLIGLDELEKSHCAADCPRAGDGSSAGNSALGGSSLGGALVDSGGGAALGGGGLANGGASSAGTWTVGEAGGSGPSGGTGTGGAAGAGGGVSAAGAGGGPAMSGLCPGGPEPALSWQEHWNDHGQLLSRVYYDDCIALYFDADVAPSAKDWLVSFLDQAWSYSLATYGAMGKERTYVVVRQGRYLGGHSSTYVEGTHDGHATIDMGAASWTEPSYDLPATLLGWLVDNQGAHTKFGAPMAVEYGSDGFPLVYAYDLYRALAMDGTADQALTTFNGVVSARPRPGTYWFRDWFYWLWKNHGGAPLFARYQALLQQYYPASADHWMPAMTYGEYFHFMNGAAGVDLAPLIKHAFGSQASFDEELAAAKQAYPDIKY